MVFGTPSAVVDPGGEAGGASAPPPLVWSKKKFVLVVLSIYMVALRSQAPLLSA